MCGICGTYAYRSRQPVGAGVLDDMLAVLQHRGPDDEGRYTDADLGLGMRRLSIIDLAGGAQPLYNEDRSVVLVCNGEIYNYRDLAADLQRRGHVLATGSDVEVIIHLYEDRGEECVQALRGMFAFALWDARRRRLLLVRDRLGIKPLYYTEAGGALIFGSEIKALLQHPGVSARPDLAALSNFLSLKYVPAPQTLFDGIAALPPGHLLRCDPGGVTIRRYWDLRFPARYDRRVPEAEYAEQLDALLRESVRLHLMSDVPFGAFLSGGLDSSTVVALMSRILAAPVQTFSVGFEGDGAACSELPYARLVAARYHTDHHEVIMRPADLIENAERVVWHLDQPIADDACLANYLVATLAARHVKMVLTGEGGDELFAGYARYAGERLAPLARRIPAPLKALALALSRHVPGQRRAKIALYALSRPDEVTRLVNWFPLFNPEMKAALFAPAVQRELLDLTADAVFAEPLARTTATDPLSRMLYVDTKLWLPDDLLARGDKMSMAASLEARVPLLDHVLVEFAAGVPPEFKLRGLVRKYLLRQVSRAWLPEAIITRRKQGFPMPFAAWFRGEARPFVRDLLAPATVRRRGLFNPGTVQALLAAHDAGRADHSSLIWGLVSVELWYRLFIDTGPSAPGSAPAGSVTPTVGAREGGTG